MMSETNPFFESWAVTFAAILEKHALMADYFEKLLLDIPDRLPSVGDRVVVAAGLLNRGPLWIRKECVVTECGSVSYRVRCTEKHDEWEEWVDRALILDILGKADTDAKHST